MHRVQHDNAGRGRGNYPGAGGRGRGRGYPSNQGYTSNQGYPNQGGVQVNSAPKNAQGLQLDEFGKVMPCNRYNAGGCDTRGCIF